ncbi:MAG: NAD-dependent malic enzyme [Elusimicrobia bacterium]|nr:NAD-dependent malic enzyme [Elusimicrobiota bacterium]
MIVPRFLDVADETIRPAEMGIRLLHDPVMNKGSAFSLEERRRLGLLGLLPPHVSTIEEQIARVLGNVRAQPDDLRRYVEMISLLDRNETLFYKVVMENLEEMMPIIYTPVVGKACQVYGHIFRRPRGLFITRRERGRVREVLRHWPNRGVRVIVVTDGERILGLGDLGANGMGIPVGKLSLYTACAGVHPAVTLPITLDVGTNSAELLADPLYLGMRENRLRGADYDELVEEFVLAVQEVFPHALIQWEDFANHNAFRVLETYKDRACTFNDDVQGTAAVTLAGLCSSAALTGLPLKEQRFLFCGAGEAAIGIGELIVAALAAEGLPKAEAAARCWFMDSKALVESTRRDLQEHKRAFAHDHAPIADLASAVRELKPTALIGVSGKKGQFTREIVAEMARLNRRPVIFALSNPTDNSECTAEQAYAWSEGRAVFASGSPFGPVRRGDQTFVPGQGNNAYIFPGVGLGVIASGASRVIPEMFLEAARTLAACATKEDLAVGRLYPALSRIQDVSARIAAVVAEAAHARGLAGEPRPEDMLAHVRSLQYVPAYKTYV